MELNIFASLYQAKEGLIFYDHFFIEEISIYVAWQSRNRSLYVNKTSAARNSEVRGRSKEPIRSTRLNPTSGGCIRLTSLHVPFFSTNRLASRLNPTSSGRFIFFFPSH